MDWRDVPCKLWTGANVKGYGQRFRKSGTRLVHRQVWEAAHGPLPPHIKVLHRCDTPACYELAHLFTGTQAENIKDMEAKGRKRSRDIRTHCGNGHEYTPENTAIYPNKRNGRTYRSCKECGRIRSRKNRALARAAV